MTDFPGNLRVPTLTDLSFHDVPLGTRIWVESYHRFFEAIPASEAYAADILGPPDQTQIAWRVRNSIIVRDLSNQVDQGIATAALTFEQFADTGAMHYVTRHDQDDTVTLKFQMDHYTVWDVPIVPHGHFMPLVAASGNVLIVGAWAFTHEDLALPTLSGWTAFESEFPVVADDLNKTKKFNLPAITIPVAARQESSVLWMRVTRKGTDPRDTFSTNKAGGTIQANLGFSLSDAHVTVYN